MIRHVIDALIGLIALGFVLFMIAWWTQAAAARLAQIEGREEATPVAIAHAADEGYCTPQLKRVLRRVLKSCGLVKDGGTRGCQPAEARSVATMSGDDFNALFAPLKERAGIIQFEAGSAELDFPGQSWLATLFADRKGASYFFVVARASPDGSMVKNRELSRERGQAVLGVLEQRFGGSDLGSEVGLLWLGEEFAQLDDDHCSWQRSGAQQECDPTQLNRSAFVAWIDCQL